MNLPIVNYSVEWVCMYLQGLSLVLSKSHIQEDPLCESMDVDANPATNILTSHEWLLEQLPALPQFSAVRSQVCIILRQACQVETNAEAVSAYIVFLSDNMVHMALQDMDELLLVSLYTWFSKWT